MFYFCRENCEELQGLTNKSLELRLYRAKGEHFLMSENKRKEK